MAGPQILVLGIGNTLLSDEGAGIHVIRELEKHNLPPEVTVLDGGTTGFELIRFFAGMEKVIIVDALRTDLETGSVVRLTPSELKLKQDIPFSIHQSGMATLINKATEFYPETELVIIGVVVEETEKFSLQLSDTVREKIPAVIDIILREICSTLAV